MSSTIRGQAGPLTLLCFLAAVFWFAPARLAAATLNLAEEWQSNVLERHKNSLVFLSVKATLHNGLEDRSNGSGFVVDPAGYVLTCKHVVPTKGDSYKSVEITGVVGGRYGDALPLKVIWRDDQVDLALLQLPERASPWPSVESSEEGRRGLQILALGFPKGQNFVGKGGLISSSDGTDGGESRWITDAALNRGMSGGPAFDRNGAVVAVVAAGYEEAEGLNLLIPITLAEPLLKRFAPHSPLLQRREMAEEAKRVRQQIMDSAESVEKIRKMFNGGIPIFAMTARLEDELHTYLKDVPTGQRRAALSDTQALTRITMAAWRDSSAAWIEEYSAASAVWTQSPQDGDWAIIGTAFQLLSNISADAFGSHIPITIMTHLSSDDLPENIESIEARSLSRDLALRVQGTTALYYIIRYENATNHIGEFMNLFSSTVAKLPDRALIEHTRAQQVDGDSLTGEILELLIRFRGEIEAKTYSHLVTSIEKAEKALSKDTAQEEYEERKESNESKRSQDEARNEIVTGIFRCVKNSGVQDPNLDMFLAVADGDPDAVGQALKNGASPLIKDSELLAKYQLAAARECPDLYEKYRTGMRDGWTSVSQPQK